MAVTVTVSIVGRIYELTCDEGQEDTVRALATELDRRTGSLLRVVGQVGDARLLVMSGLRLVDELGELQEQLSGRVAGEQESLLQELTEQQEIIRELTEHRDHLAVELAEQQDMSRLLSEQHDAMVSALEQQKQRVVTPVIDEAADAALAETITRLADHIEAIAERLEKA